MPRPTTRNPERLYVGSLRLKVSRTQLLEALDQYGYTGPTSYSKQGLALILATLCAGGEITEDAP